jgi:YbbR domain-containing protein
MRRMKIFKNIELKLISLAIAATLWVIVTGKEYRYGDFTIPIELKGLPESLIITREGSDKAEIKNATVRIRANETILRNIDDRTMYLSINVSSLSVGTHQVQITNEMVTGKPAGAEITDITPRELELTVEESITRPFVVVNPELLGKPAEGFDIYQITCTPPTVSIKGPKSSVEKIDKVSTYPVQIDNLTETNLRRDLQLISPDPLVTIIPDEVSLRAEIHEKMISEVFQNVPVEVRSSAYLARVNPKSLTVWVQGPISQMKRLKRENVQVFVSPGGDRNLKKTVRIEPELVVIPQDSFPDVTLEKFSQKFLDVYLTGRKKAQ